MVNTILRHKEVEHQSGFHGDGLMVLQLLEVSGHVPTRERERGTRTGWGVILQRGIIKCSRIGNVDVLRTTFPE